MVPHCIKLWLITQRPSHTSHWLLRVFSKLTQSGNPVHTLSDLLLCIPNVWLSLNDPIVLLVPSLVSLLPLLLMNLPLEFICQVVLGDRWPHFVWEFLKQVQLHLEGSVNTDLFTLVLHPVWECLSATQVARILWDHISTREAALSLGHGWKHTISLKRGLIHTTACI